MDEEVFYFFLILKAFSKVMLLSLFRATVRDTDIQYKGQIYNHPNKRVKLKTTFRKTYINTNVDYQERA